MSLSEIEIELLKVIETRGLVRRSEIPRLISKVNGASISALNTLIDMGLVTVISPLGEKSYAITKEGLRVLKETERI